MSFITEIKTFAALGSGVIGSGWVSRALAHGLDVVAWDPAPGAEAALRNRVANCWGALEQQGLVPAWPLPWWKTRPSARSSPMWALKVVCLPMT